MKNPAPVGRWFIPLYAPIFTVLTIVTNSYPLVQDFVHPQYIYCIINYTSWILMTYSRYQSTSLSFGGSTWKHERPDWRTRSVIIKTQGVERETESVLHISDYNIYISLYIQLLYVPSISHWIYIYYWYHWIYDTCYPSVINNFVPLTFRLS